ncbi:tetratricopeptide repeat protein [Cytobacillus gottheilii]|uniref:Tetratricopeptide repeat protein n=1 Tax=Cytobacillus gottheilii TaxID=859144 RepID=A0ABX8FEX1_9BACI|nr:tetratricopeptide repeat protein [Cytobacillus gottheilii]QVY62547.1 tetratricopeptide repeat protein [Cytobacillus gottheilii]
MRADFEKAIQLRKRGNLEESNELLIQLVSQFPNNASINYHCAWSYDLLGEEPRAVSFYENAIRLGLASEELEGAIVKLGSTYRTLGEYQKSEKAFEKGIGLFPNNKAIQVFYAITLYNLSQHDQAMVLLLKVLIHTTNDEEILGYKKAIEFYADKLDEVWE